VELFNRSTNTTFDLSGWIVNGLNYTFPASSTLRPQSYLLLAKSSVLFASTFNPLVPVFGMHGTIHGGDNGMLNGFLVAAIGIPLLLFLVGSASLLAGNAAANSTQNDRVIARGQMDGNSNQAVLASDTNRASGNNSVADGSSANRSQNRDDEVRTARRTAWSTLISLILAIGAASFAGLIGARDDNRTIRRDDRGTQGTVMP